MCLFSFSLLHFYSALSPVHALHPPLEHAGKRASAEGHVNSITVLYHRLGRRRRSGTAALNSVRKGQRTALGPDTVMWCWRIKLA